MQQIPLSEEFGGLCSEKLFIHYEGSDEGLATHEIDAIAYATSIKGYSIFVQKIVESFLGTDVKIRISAHQRGSFIDIFSLSWETVYKVGALMTIASWLGVDAKCIKGNFSTVLIAIQNKFFSLIIDANGDTDIILRYIYSSGELPKEEQEQIASLIKDSDIRNGLDSFTCPLDKQGYDRIIVSDILKYSAQITSAQRHAFQYNPPDVKIEELFQDTVSIVYLSPELSKWQFQGKKIFWADILDENFLNKTKDKKFSDLKGKRYFVSGIKYSTIRDGKVKGKPMHTIDRVVEISEALFLV